MSLKGKFNKELQMHKTNILKTDPCALWASEYFLMILQIKKKYQ